MRIRLLFALLLAGFAAAGLPARADRIVMKDGRVLEGKVEKEETDRVLLRMKLGSVWLLKSDIASVEREPDPEEEFEMRRKAVPAGDVSAWVELGEFCLLKELVSRAEECFRNALAADPRSTRARSALDRIEAGRAVERIASAATLADALEEWSRVEPLGDIGREAFAGAILTRAARLDWISADGTGLQAWAGSELRSLRQGIRSTVMNERLYTDRADATRARVLGMVARLNAFYDGPHHHAFLSSHASAARLSAEARNLSGLHSLFEGADPAAVAALNSSIERALRAFAGAAAAACAQDPESANARTSRANAEAAIKAGLGADEEVGLALVNEYRVRLGLRALKLDRALHEAARSHSRAMSTHGFFSHESPLPGMKTPYARIRKAGYDWRIAGENIARCEGGLTPRRALEAWIDSPGHHRNLLRPEFEDAGLGVDGEYWTLDLAARRKD